jgi:hypothetical protein
MSSTIDNVPQFSYDDVRYEEFRDGYMFTAAMISACDPLFDSCYSNYEVEDKLQEAGVIKTDTDSESCQMFIYFSTRSVGENFIDRLNEYLRNRAEKYNEYAEEF